MENNKPDFEQTERWRKDPSNWTLGLFYFNPEDKRLLPRKRIRELGWTINFANLHSVMILAGIALLAFTVIYFGIGTKG